MGSNRNTSWLREALLALLVLSLFCLNFTQASAAADPLPAGGHAAVVATSSLCGDSAPGDSGSHVVCHACRPTLAALPPAPTTVRPVVFAAAPVAFADCGCCAAIEPLRLGPTPRGPPELA